MDSQPKKLDPALRERLINESKSPWRGLRRLLWIAFSGSSFIGLFIMLLRGVSGQGMILNDIAIQLSACFVFVLLLFWDKQK